MDTPPRSFGRYEITAEIGGGAMGRVYRGWDPLVQRAVAIKTLRRERLVPQETADALRRFRREAQAAGALSHPHIVNIFDVGDDYIVMELLDGVSLHQLLATRGRLAPAETLALLWPVADALDHAHAAGVIHRDIKPGNVMVAPDGRPKLTDFGLARLESAAATRPGEVFGSPSYMAPEQVAGDTVTARADVYALAVMAYECLTGRRPFEGQNVTAIVYRVLHEQPARARSLVPELPPALDEELARALDKDPSRRHATAGELLVALHAAAGLPVPPSSTPRVPRMPPAAARTLSGGEPTLGYEDLPPAAPPVAALPAREAASRLSPARGVVALLALAAVLAAGALLARRETATPPAPSGASLRVVSEPEAGVWIDERAVGRTPLEIRLARGAHTVRVAQDGFGPAQVGVEVTDGAPLAPLRFLLQPLSASLTVTSVPSGAVVRLGEQTIGRTPIERMALPPGVHEVSLEHPGYARFTRTLAAEAGETAVLDATLERGRRAPERRVAVGDLVRPEAPGVSPPKRVQGEAPAYPPAARTARVSGSVLVAMIVDENGLPTNLRVIESAGELLDQAVLQALRGWRFEPARKDGVAVKYPFRQKLTFELPRS